MAEIVVFHHAHGLTPGMRRFADRFRAAGHTVHTPDLFEGRTFDSLDEGVAYADGIGLEPIIERGISAVQVLPESVFYAGLSLGGMVAQALTQTRAGAKGALLISAAAPAKWFGEWPSGVPLQIHAAESDTWVELDAARELATTVRDAELFVYPGDRHLFADETLPDYDSESARLLMDRALTFVSKAG
jgi:dienelactone hydrolase